MPSLYQLIFIVIDEELEMGNVKKKKICMHKFCYFQNIEASLDAFEMFRFRPML